MVKHVEEQDDHQADDQPECKIFIERAQLVSP
jgi:hypothetical protein